MAFSRYKDRGKYAAPNAGGSKRVDKARILIPRSQPLQTYFYTQLV